MAHTITREACPGCDTPNGTLLFSCQMNEQPVHAVVARYASQEPTLFEMLEQVSYELVQCSYCGMIYQKNILDELSTRSLYTAWLDPQKEHQHDKNRDIDFPIFYMQELLSIAAYMKKKPRELTVLDFGAGWGGYQDMARACGCSVHGYDLSSAKTAAGEHQCYITYSNEDEIPENTFDIINVEQVFEHLATPRMTLIRLLKSLKKGGVLKIAVPAPAWRIRSHIASMQKGHHALFDTILNPVYPLEHINCFTPTNTFNGTNAIYFLECCLKILCIHAEIFFRDTFSGKRDFDNGVTYIELS
jgi:2-polyprenyl-3-methyl-5-hydroxy-6-metoxy-1,4-benzoquinol methylase